MKADKDLITAQSLAEALNLSVETIWRYTREKRIPFVELGRRQYRYNLEEVVRTLDGGEVHEQPARYETRPAKKLTYQDYLEIPDEPGYRFEILNGILVKEPSPNVTHQRVSRRLQRLLEDYFMEADPQGEVFDAPLDVTFQDISVVQPDIFYISGLQQSIVKDTRIDGPPTLVVEVLSPSNSRKDRLQKLQIYQEAGVQHYWIVNPQENTLECFALQNGLYTLAAAGMDHDVVEPPAFQGLSVALKSLW